MVGGLQIGLFQSTVNQASSTLGLLLRCAALRCTAVGCLARFAQMMYCVKFNMAGGADSKTHWADWRD